MASIRERTLPDGTKRFDVMYRVHGKQVAKTCRTKTEAKAIANSAERDEMSGAGVNPRAGNITFGEYAEQWIATRTTSKGLPLTPMTTKGYLALLRRNLAPTFGSAKLRMIRPEHVRAWYIATAAKSPDQAAKSYRFLRAVMNTAVDDDRISQTPCRMKGAGTEHAAERPLVSTTVVLALADVITARLRAFVLLAGFGGLRTGELLGLQRGDVDELRGVVKVRRQVHEVSGKARTAAGKRTATRVVTGPKSEAGRRDVALPRSVMTELAQHLAEHTGAASEAPVFATARGDEPLRRADISKAWRAAVKAVAEAPDNLHPHDLRHHAATLTARKPGVTTKELMSHIGHSTPRAALLYQHATAERERGIADWLEEQIAAAPRPEVATVTRLPGGAS